MASFIRFVLGASRDSHQSLTGVVTEARLLREQGHLADYESETLEEFYDWLNENLPVPPFSKSRWPKNAVAWFKDDASEPIRRMWDLVALLEQHGRPVRILRSHHPGRVLYEDEYQVVVEEWSRL